MKHVYLFLKWGERFEGQGLNTRKVPLGVESRSASLVIRMLLTLVISLRNGSKITSVS